VAHAAAFDSVKPISMLARSWVIAVASAVSACGHSAVALSLSGFFISPEHALKAGADAKQVLCKAFLIFLIVSDYAKVRGKHRLAELV